MSAGEGHHVVFTPLVRSSCLTPNLFSYLPSLLTMALEQGVWGLRTFSSRSSAKGWREKGKCGKGRGPGQPSILVLSSCIWNLPPINICPVFIFLGFLGAVQGWWVCSMLCRAPGVPCSTLKPWRHQCCGLWAVGCGLGGQCRLGLCTPIPSHAHASFFVLSSVVPGCTHGRRRAQTP